MKYQAQIDQALQTKQLLPEAAAHIATWLSQSKYAAYQPEIEQLLAEGQWEVLNDSFFKVLPFGTGGRRGTVGVGPNRINRVTIGESAQGLATYLHSQGTPNQSAGVVIAHDTRVTSRELAELTAEVFAANNLKVYLFDTFRATPELSFAVRHLRAAAGVVISASHNPASDNGFKVYWQDGGQVVPPFDGGIMQAVEQVTAIKTLPLAEATSQGLVQVIGDDVDQAYIQAVIQESVISSRSARLAYSPLHGCGSRSALPVLQAAGFTEVSVVNNQATPDGTFPNIKNNIPNPEVPSASEEVTKLAQEKQADIAITTDPDADRLGVVALGPEGQYHFLTGNQIAALIGHFVMSQLQAQGKLTAHHFVVKTIVTTDFLTAMAQQFKLKIYDNILIGFKYVADLIHTHQDEGTEQFLFGGEESHGILKGSYTRDKDAAVAALLMAELTSFYKDQGKTVVEALYELYRQYGLYVETLQNIAYPGASGNETMNRLMTMLRTQPPKVIGTLPVHSVIDRQQETDPKLKGNVLIFNLSADGQTRLTVRPSGTEPKLKLYIQTHQELDSAISHEALSAQLTTAQTQAQALGTTLQTYFQQILA